MNLVNFYSHGIEKNAFLIVDDFGDMRSMLRGMLNSFGVKDIDSVATGQDAIDAIEEKRYDIILCDYNLGPGKNGQQILEEARHRELIGLGSVFVMITAENTWDMVMGAVEYEPDSYLTKPFTKDLLKSRLEKLVARKKNLEDVEEAARRKEYEKAIQLLDLKISKRPKNLGELTKLKADLCYRAGDYKQAAGIYERVLAAREMPWAKLGLGKVMFSSGRLDEAKRLFEEILEDNERLTAAHDWLARIHQAQDRPIDAQRILQKAVMLSPKAILRQKTLGELALKNQDNQTAERALIQAVELGLHSVYKAPAIYASLAKAKSRTGSGEEGLKVLRNMEREFQGDLESELYSAMIEGGIQSDMGNTEEADACLGRAAALHEQLGVDAGPELTLELARTCNQLGNGEQAKELLHQVVRNNHAEEAFLKEVGQVYEELGTDNDSASFIAEIKQEIVQINNRGVEMAKAGQLEEAVDLFRKAVEGMPGNKVVNLNAARVLVMYMQQHGVDGEELGRVRSYLDRVHRQDPENQALRRVLVMYHGLAG